MRARTAEPEVTPMTAWEELPRMLSVAEVATLMRTTPQAVRGWIRSGLPACRGLTMIRVDKHELQAWLERER